MSLVFRRSWWSGLCLAAAVMAQAGKDELPERINRALDQARPALVFHLRDAVGAMGRCGEVGLVCLAALHDGMDPAQAPLADALRVLLQFDSTALETYDLALRLLVLEVWAAPDRDKLAKADCKQLLAHRDDDGFGYVSHGGRADLSNTQYAALGLRAARSLGVPIERKVWTALLDDVVAAQTNYGGFGYTKSRDGDPYASMTVAGIAVLAICQQALGDQARGATQASKHIARGWQWMDKNVADIGNRMTRWSYYFHYGLERAAILTDVKDVGREDWYRRGAKMFVDDQLTGGGWTSPQHGARPDAGQGRGDAVSTAFAVLFLRRKFQKVAGPLTLRSVTLPQLDDQAGDADVAACAEGLVKRGKSAMPDILRALSGEVAPRRRAAAVALKAIAGDDFGFDYRQDAAHNRGAIAKAELWHLKNQ